MKIIKQAFTFDDVLLVPAHSKVMPKEVSLKTKLTKNISLNTPIVSAAMDTVTESRLAITIAQEGGIGIIHKNMSIEEQANEVRKVKRFESGIIREPITISPDATISDVIDIQDKHSISALPVIENGKVVGLITSRDVRFETRLNQKVKDVMTPQSKLITVEEDTDKASVRSLLHKHRIERVLVVGKSHELMGMITVKDIQKQQTFQMPVKTIKSV